MKKEIKRWGPIICAFVCWCVMDIFDDFFSDINVQIIFNFVCLGIMLVSLVFLFMENEKHSVKNILHNKWVILSVVLGIIIFIYLCVSVVDI